ncbi:MAG: sugar transferase [Flavobacteria bacterium RIFCSPLOWO2_12_FULL_35_11]|nr:MAG: sugar transferase [Flavobacteria bacterium RIFCSPLOWO2_12_FULL_35_11]
MPKRLFDILFSIFALLILGWLMIICWLFAAIDTKSNGLFIQKRIGQFGHSFNIYKLKSMKEVHGIKTISRFGNFIRKTRIDEWPQLLNVFTGTMSVVGPRPDVPGYYDKLQGADRKILELKPGLTSPATLKYANEEALLAQQENPLHYNDTILFPDKVTLNLHYYHTRTFFGDLKIIWQTAMSLLRKKAS